MTKLPVFLLCIALLSASLSAEPSTLVLNDPAYPKFNATGLDQPVLDVYLTDPENGDQVFTDYNEWEEREYPIIFRAFVDTGASGFVISHLLATGQYDEPNLGFTEADYIGTYTETGIGGSEEGKVSRPLGVHLLNGQRYAGHEGNLEEFIGYGDFNLWVRQQEGFGERMEYEGFALTNPVNIIGMPVIRQRVMILDPSGLQGSEDEIEYLATFLVPPDAEQPEHNVTLQMYLHDFSGDQPPAGETFPSHASNPMLPGMTVTHTPTGGATASTTGNWLFDTGAGSSFLAFAHAKKIGLIPEAYESLDAFVRDHEEAGGKVAVVGGIGGDPVKVPILTVDEIRVPATEGFDIAWQNVDILIHDIAELVELGLDGIFGMNLILPAVTVDSNDPENLDQLYDVSPGVFRSIVFDATDEQNVELRLFTYRLATSFGSWQETYFGGTEAPAGDTDADPDADGLPNLLEYAFGTHPLVPSQERLPRSEIRAVAGEDYLTLTYERVKPSPDLTFTVETSADLASWSSGGEVVEVIDDGNREIVTVRGPQPIDVSNQHFMRVRVELTGN